MTIAGPLLYLHCGPLLDLNLAIPDAVSHRGGLSATPIRVLLGNLVGGWLGKGQRGQKTGREGWEEGWRSGLKFIEGHTPEWSVGTQAK
eukprot:1410089-Rhodomonas_salina.2